MARRYRQRIQILHQCPHLIAMMLTVLQIGDTVYDMPIGALIQMLQQLHNSLFGLTVYYNRALIHMTFVGEIRSTRTQQKHPCLRLHRMNLTNHFQIVLNRQVHRPDAIYISRLLLEFVQQLFDRQAVIDTIQIGYFVLLLHTSRHLQLVDIRGRIDHTGTPRTPLCRMTANHHRWDQKTNFVHIIIFF